AGDAGYAVETLKQLGDLVCRDPDARVHDAELDAIVDGLEGDSNLALQGKLEGIRDQVQHNLFPHLDVDVDRFRQRGTLHLELEPRPLARRTKRAGELRGIGGEVGGFEASAHPS